MAQGEPDDPSRRAYQPRTVGSFFGEFKAHVEKLAAQPAPTLEGDDPDHSHPHRRTIEPSTEASLAEANCLRLPFAVLWDKDTGRKEPLIIQHTLWNEPTQVEHTISWEVRPGDLGMPGPFDRRVWRALESIVLGRTVAVGLPLTNPQPITIIEIIRKLRLAKHFDNYKAIATALHRINGTRLVDKGALRVKKGKKKINQDAGVAFHLIDRISWRSWENQDTGEVEARTHLWLGSPYVESVNAGYIKPLDWNLWISFRRAIAQRLYEVLDLDFWGLKSSPYVVYTYAQLCELLPVRPQKHRSNAMQVLTRAHEELRKKRVLDRVEWLWEDLDARIRYFPNPDYLAQVRARKLPELDTKALELAKELRDFKSLALYQRIAANVEQTHIQAALGEVRMARHSGKVRAPGAYFTKVLAAILQSRGLPVPFEIGAGSKRRSARQCPPERA